MLILGETQRPHRETDPALTRTPWRLLTLLAAVTALAMLAGCEAGSKTADADEEEETPIPVEVLAVDRGDITALYLGTAPLEVDAQADAIAKVGGEIVALEVEEGDPVEAGQVLARLDGERLRLEVARQQANVRRLEQEYRRNVDLHEKGLVSAGAFEGMKYELDALRAALEVARLDLGYTQIRAPIAGVVAQRHVKLGNTVAINQRVYTITDLDPLIAYLHVPEKELSKLAPGQLATVQVDALPGLRFNGVVKRLSPTVDADTGTFKVTVEVADATGGLKPGMFGRVAIIYDTRADALLVPRAALLDGDAERAVFVVEDGVARRRVVTTGYTSGSNVEVRNGLADGERIVVVGQNGLKDGGKVRVVGDPEPDTRTAVEQQPAPDSAG